MPHPAPSAPAGPPLASVAASRMLRKSLPPAGCFVIDRSTNAVPMPTWNDRCESGLLFVCGLGGDERDIVALRDFMVSVARLCLREYAAPDADELTHILLTYWNESIKAKVVRCGAQHGGGRVHAWPGNPAAFVRSAIRRRAIDFARRRGRWKPAELHQEAEDTLRGRPHDHHSMYDGEAAAEGMAFLRRSDVSLEVKAAVLCQHMGYSWDEIGKMLGRSGEAVRKQVERWRKEVARER